MVSNFNFNTRLYKQNPVLKKCLYEQTNVFQQLNVGIKKMLNFMLVSNPLNKLQESSWENIWKSDSKWRFWL